MRTIDWDDERDVVKLTDQTSLPEDYKITVCACVDELIDAIKRLKVRGAPALGVAGAFGAFGVALAYKNKDGRDERELIDELEKLKKARPTAINLSYGVNRALQAARRGCGRSVQEMKSYALDEAKRLVEEDIAVNKKIGEYGSVLLEDGDVVLTHYNAGRLACVDWGTAL